MKMVSVLAAAAAALLLAGCNMQTLQGSVAGSCAVFERPPYAVRGATPYDQRVADGFVESGVAGCGWQRPAARPPELERPAAKLPAKKPPAKKRLVDRVSERILPAPKPADPPPAITAPAEPEPAPKFEERFPAPPRSPTALEQLLGGRK